MKTPALLAVCPRSLTAALLAVLVSASGVAGAQVTSSSAQQQTTANQIPLSGRTSQAGSVTSTQQAVPGTTTSVNTINPAVQVAGPYTGSTASTDAMPFSGKLSFGEAIRRGLGYNLAGVGLTAAVRQTQGQARAVRSALLPNFNGSLSETVQQTNLQALGVRFSSPIPGFTFPTVVGPFNFFDLRARLSQTVVDVTALNNYRSATQTERATALFLRDAKDLIVLAVGGAYLQAIAARARLDSARAQLDTANALYAQTLAQRKVGLVAQVDVDRSEVQVLTQKQRIASLGNDLAKQKINLARMTGLPPNDRYEITDDVPFEPGAAVSADDAVEEAFRGRSDLKAAEAQVRAAERIAAAARAERLPSVALNGDYGVIGTNPANSHGTFSVAGTLRIPIWQGGRAEGDIEQAGAAVSQRRAELEDQKAEIESEVRKAYLDLEAAATQVEVAKRNIQVSQETLDLTRQRFEAGVADNVEVVQAQESLASANLDYINSVFAHNLAKLSLARSVGNSEENLPRFLKLR